MTPLTSFALAWPPLHEWLGWFGVAIGIGALAGVSWIVGAYVLPTIAQLLARWWPAAAHAQARLERWLSESVLPLPAGSAAPTTRRPLFHVESAGAPTAGAWPRVPPAPRATVAPIATPAAWLTAIDVIARHIHASQEGAGLFAHLDRPTQETFYRAGALAIGRLTPIAHAAGLHAARDVAPDFERALAAYEAAVLAAKH